MSEEEIKPAEEPVVEDTPTDTGEPDSTKEGTPGETEESPSSVEETTDETSEDDETSSQDPVEYNEIGNEVYDTIGRALTSEGIDPSVFAGELESQLLEGAEDASLSEESFKELSDKFGEPMATLMEKQFINEFKNELKKKEEITQEVFSLFGGKEQMAQITETIVKEKLATEDEVNELGKMLVQGGVKQKAAEKIIKEMYMSTEDFEQNPQLLDEGDNAKPVGIQPISRADYTAQKMKAMADGDKVTVEQLNKRAKFTMEKTPHNWK